MNIRDVDAEVVLKLNTNEDFRRAFAALCNGRMQDAAAVAVTLEDRDRALLLFMQKGMELAERIAEMTDGAGGDASQDGTTLSRDYDLHVREDGSDALVAYINSRAVIAEFRELYGELLDTGQN